MELARGSGTGQQAHHQSTVVACDVDQIPVFEQVASLRPGIVTETLSGGLTGHGFCHVSRRLQRVARPEPSDDAISMMPIAMRAR